MPSRNGTEAAAVNERMYLVRVLEDRLQALCLDGLAGDLHFSKGQEAIPVGVCSMLRPSDYVVTHHRTIAHAIAKGVPLGPLVIFVFVSGALKLLYHVGDVLRWLTTRQKEIRSGRILVRVLVRILIVAERILNVAADRILAGKTLAQRLPTLANVSFSWMLIVYLALLTAEEFKKGWTQAHLHVELNIVMVLVIFLGMAAILLNKEHEVVIQKTTVFNAASNAALIRMASASAAAIMFARARSASEASAPAAGAAGVAAVSGAAGVGVVSGAAGVGVVSGPAGAAAWTLWVAGMGGGGGGGGALPVARAATNRAVPLALS